MKKINKKHARRRGTAIVELAIVFILLLMLTLGIVAFGFLFYQVQHVIYLARHGARTGARWGANEQTIRNELAPLMNVNEQITEISFEGEDPGDEVTVSVEVRNLDFMNLGDFLTRGPLMDNYTATVTMPKEGP